MEPENSEQVTEQKEPLNGWRIVVYLTVLAGLLAFWGLGNNDLWDDEASSAVYGRNLMKTGKLIAWDGRNIMPYGMLALVNEDMIRTFSAPLQYPVAGLSLKIFGDSAAGGRTLFVLIGLFSIPLVAAWFKNEFDSEDFWIVALILALSVPYLLYIRQLRYYPLGLTSAAGLLWVWSVIPHARKYRWWLLLGTFFLFVLIFSQYLHAAAVCAVIAISLVRERSRNRKNLIFLAVIILAGLASVARLLVVNPHLLEQALDSGATSQISRFARLMFMPPRDAALCSRGKRGSGQERNQPPQEHPSGIGLRPGNHHCGFTFLKADPCIDSHRCGYTLLYFPHPSQCRGCIQDL